MAFARSVTASYYGGPTDPSSGAVGASGLNLYDHPQSFAELSNNWQASGGWDFSALGGLPMGAAVDVFVPSTNRSMVLYKRDVGRGGPALINGYPRAIDIWFEPAAQLGITGLDIVVVRYPPNQGGDVTIPGQIIPGPLAPQQADTQIPVADYDPSEIIRNAFWQLGVHGQRAYDNANNIWDYVRSKTYCGPWGPS